MGNYSQPFPTVIDAVIKALEKALPERVTGAHFGTLSGVRFRGRTATGSPFDCHDSGHGGWKPSPGRSRSVKKSGAKEIIHKTKGYPLEPGDEIIVETGGGGGYGPTSERPRELIERDLRRGYLSIDAVERDYGIKLRSEFLDTGRS